MRVDGLLKYIPIRAQEPEAPVTYCEYALSIVCRLAIRLPVCRPSAVR